MLHVPKAMKLYIFLIVLFFSQGQFCSVLFGSFGIWLCRMCQYTEQFSAKQVSFFRIVDSCRLDFICFVSLFNFTSVI